MGQAIAIGNFSTAMGNSLTTASGQYSFAEGSNCTASGSYSTASGFYTTASAYASIAVGVYNIGGGNATTWVDTDPLFEIGNGKPPGPANSYIPTPSDALVVYKNGNVAAQGVITAAPGGDIPMYTGE